MNKEVSFSIAKLLKEKGFDIPCTKGWINYLTSFTGETGMPDDESNLVLDRLGNPHLIERPTIADVVMWLYEKYGVWVSCDAAVNLWFYSISTPETGKMLVSTSDIHFNSPTEAYEAGIEHTLENLI